MAGCMAGRCRPRTRASVTPRNSPTVIACAHGGHPAHPATRQGWPVSRHGWAGSGRGGYEDRRTWVYWGRAGSINNKPSLFFCVVLGNFLGFGCCDLRIIGFAFFFGWSILVQFFILVTISHVIFNRFGRRTTLGCIFSRWVLQIFSYGSTIGVFWLGWH